MEFLSISAVASADMAAGADVWRFVHIAGWLGPLLEALADFHWGVEAAGSWPQECPPHLVALLPKGCTAGPLDRRPVVLPVVYGLCAAARAGLMRGWPRGAGVLRAGPLATSDALARPLGLELDEAHAEGEPVVGLALESFKRSGGEGHRVKRTSLCRTA